VAVGILSSIHAHRQCLVFRLAFGRGFGIAQYSGTGLVMVGKVAVRFHLRAVILLAAIKRVSVRFETPRNAAALSGDD
jgi:hypothetical protein